MVRGCSICSHIGRRYVRTCTCPSTSQLKQETGGPSIDDDGDYFNSSSPFSVSEFVMKMMNLAPSPTSASYSWTEFERLIHGCTMACDLEKMIMENNQAHQDSAAAPLAQQTNRSGAWSEEEHRRFLEGVETLGLGDWKGISENFVPTRTRTQVAGHAYNYFLKRQQKTTTTARP